MVHTNMVPRNWIVHSTGWRAEQGLRQPGLRSYRAYAETGRTPRSLMSRDRAFTPQELVGTWRKWGEKKKESRRRAGGDERRKNACARAATRVNVAQCRARENRAEKTSTRIPLLEANGGGCCRCFASCLCHEREYAPHAYTRACYVYAYICVYAFFAAGSAVRERNSLPEPRYLEESPFLLHRRRHLLVVPTFRPACREHMCVTL